MIRNVCEQNIVDKFLPWKNPCSKLSTSGRGASRKRHDEIRDCIIYHTISWGKSSLSTGLRVAGWAAPLARHILLLWLTFMKLLDPRILLPRMMFTKTCVTFKCKFLRDRVCFNRLNSKWKTPTQLWMAPLYRWITGKNVDTEFTSMVEIAALVMPTAADSWNDENRQPVCHRLCWQRRDGGREVVSKMAVFLYYLLFSDLLPYVCCHAHCWGSRFHFFPNLSIPIDFYWENNTIQVWNFFYMVWLS